MFRCVMPAVRLILSRGVAFCRDSRDRLLGKAGQGQAPKPKWKDPFNTFWDLQYKPGTITEMSKVRKKAFKKLSKKYLQVLYRLEAFAPPPKKIAKRLFKNIKG